jgi:hypothetical protein
LAAGDVELDKHPAVLGDVEDVASPAVLDTLTHSAAVLFDERHPVALT